MVCFYEFFVTTKKISATIEQKPPLTPFPQPGVIFKPGEFAYSRYFMEADQTVFVLLCECVSSLLAGSLISLGFSFCLPSYLEPHQPLAFALFFVCNCEFSTSHCYAKYYIHGHARISRILPQFI